jgi:hypothetical protein
MSNNVRIDTLTAGKKWGHSWGHPYFETTACPQNADRYRNTFCETA